MSSRQKPISHGTKGGYMAHRRRDEKPCPPCSAAWTDYYRKYREETGR